MNRPAPRRDDPHRASLTTLAELYCRQEGCPPGRFRRRIFWRVLHWHALPFAPLLLLAGYFKADRDLIDACGRATRLDQVYDEIGDHPFNPRNQGWLRREAKCRVSLRRLGAIARDYLPPLPPRPPIGALIGRGAGPRSAFLP